MSSVDIGKAIHALVAADATVAAYLATYKGQPAVFTRRPVPPDAELPYLVVETAAAVERTNTLDGKLPVMDVERQLSLFGPATGDPDAIDAAAERLAWLLHQRLLAVPGWTRARCTVVAGPGDLSADDESYGRVLTVRTHLTR